MAGERGGRRSGAPLITPDRVTGEAVALAREGDELTLTLADPMQGDASIDSEVVVLDMFVVAGPHVDAGITPDVSVQEFVSAVRDSRAATNGSPAAEASVPTDASTARERAVLAELLAGHDDRLIAARLRISEQTVRTYAHSTLTKLGVRSRSEAVSRVLLAGIVPAGLTQEATS